MLKKTKTLGFIKNEKTNVQTTDFDKNLFNRNQKRCPYLAFSYNISLMISKSGKPHTIDVELIILVISKVIRTVLHNTASCIIKKMRLTTIQ